MVTKAREASQSKKYDDCVKFASKAIDISPFFTELRSIRASCNLHLGNPAISIIDLQWAAQLGMENLDIYNEIANLSFFYLDEYAQAIASLRTCLQSDPENKRCKTTFKQIKKLKKSLDKLVVELSKEKWNTCGKMITPPNGSPGLLSEVTANVDYLNKQYGMTTSITSKVLKRIIDIACISHANLKRWKLADEYCSQSLDFDANNVDAMLGKAGALLDREEFDAAIKILGKAQQQTQGQNRQVQEKLHEAQKRKQMAGRKDYYKILDVPRDADQRLIKRAYRKKAQEWHPDRYKGNLSNDEVQNKMAEINQAYEVLSNEEMRARFDQGDDPNDPTGGGQGGGGGPGHPFAFHANGHPFMFQHGGFGPGANVKFKFGGAKAKRQTMFHLNSFSETVFHFKIIHLSLFIITNSFQKHIPHNEL